MGDQRKMRASDHDRQQVVEQLRSALEDGRLTMEEYVDWMEVAYQAATYGDLSPLCADLQGLEPGDRQAADGRDCHRATVRYLPRRLPGWPADGAQDPVDHVADRRVGQRGHLGPGQRHRRSPGLPLASLGGRFSTGRCCSPSRLGVTLFTRSKTMADCVIVRLAAGREPGVAVLSHAWPVAARATGHATPPRLRTARTSR